MPSIQFPYQFVIFIYKWIYVRHTAEMLKNYLQIIMRRIGYEPMFKIKVNFPDNFGAEGHRKPNLF